MIVPVWGRDEEKEAEGLVRWTNLMLLTSCLKSLDKCTENSVPPPQTCPQAASSFGISELVSQWMELLACVSTSLDKQMAWLLDEVPQGCPQLVLGRMATMLTSPVLPCPNSRWVKTLSCSTLRIAPLSPSSLREDQRETLPIWTGSAGHLWPHLHSLDPNEQSANSHTFWDGGLGRGEVCTFVYTVCTWSWVGVMWNHLGGREQREGYGWDWGECGSNNSFFPFPFSRGWATGKQLLDPGYF